VTERHPPSPRSADLPPAPDLSQIKYGKTISLFNGKDLSGWKLMGENSVNGWSVVDGVMLNNPAQEEGKPHIHYGNLRTTEEFEDFKSALFDESDAGISIKELYLTSDRKSPTVTLNQEYRSFTFEKVPSFVDKLKIYFEYHKKYDKEVFRR
jgi:hypothetical protein